MSRIDCSDPDKPLTDDEIAHLMKTGGMFGGEDLNRRLLATIAALKALLKEADGLLVQHHEMGYADFEEQECPVCAKSGKYPNNIFGRIEKVMR